MSKTVLYNNKYAALRPFVEQLPSRFNEEGTLVQDRRNTIKLFVCDDGTELVVKRYRIPHGINRLIYSIGIRKPKGERAFLYVERLMKKGIESPTPIAYIEEREWGLLAYSYLVSLKCPYEHRMYELGYATAEIYEPFAQAFGEYCARLHEAEILHRDFSPGNVLWSKDEMEKYHFSLVDINQMEFGRVSLQKGCRNLCKFWGPKRMIQIIARSYGEARGGDPEDCEHIVMEARYHFWIRYQRKRPNSISFKPEL